MASPHPDYPRFFAAFASGALGTDWKGDVLRSAAPRWVSKPYRFTGGGAIQTGGRWNTHKLIPAVYFSTSIDTLNAEADAWAVRYGWTVGMLKTQTRITVQLELQEVLDLTAPHVLSALGVTNSDLIRCDWKKEQDANREAMTQAIGRCAFENMMEGLVVPSARVTGGINVIVFPSHRRDGSKIITSDEGAIPFMPGL